MYENEDLFEDSYGYMSPPAREREELSEIGITPPDGASISQQVVGVQVLLGQSDGKVVGRLLKQLLINIGFIILGFRIDIRNLDIK